MKAKDTVNRTTETDVLIDAESVSLEGSLCVPDGATSIVLFAHGSGSGRYSPRNRFVAETLRSAGMGTLLFDLLTHDEEIFDQRTTTALEEVARIAASWFRRYLTPLDFSVQTAQSEVEYELE